MFSVVLSLSMATAPAMPDRLFGRAAGCTGAQAQSVQTFAVPVAQGCSGGVAATRRHLFPLRHRTAVVGTYTAVPVQAVAVQQAAPVVTAPPPKVIAPQAFVIAPPAVVQCAPTVVRQRTVYRAPVVRFGGCPNGNCPR